MMYTGALLSQQRYREAPPECPEGHEGGMPFGEVRAEVGTISQTDFGYIGQRSISMLSIMDYNARFYDPAIGRFLQPDTIVSGAGNPQTWNRYAYTLNNPLRFSDPTGHTPCVGDNWDDGPRCLHQGGSILKTVVENTRYQKECAAGKRPECRGGRKGMVAFGVTSIVAIGLAETFILGGGLASAADAAGGLLAEAGRQAVTACARNLACWRLAVGLGILSYYPANNGFSSSPISTTLQPGQIITRYGPTTGQYASPIGTSITARALPPGTDLLSISGFEVIQPIENVLAGPVQAWFGQPGRGTQFFLGVGRTIQSLIESGHLIQLP